MTNPKHTIPVSEVRPGDSIRIGGHVRFVTSAAPWHDWIEQIVLTCAPMVGLRRTFWVDLGTALTVGFTNRKAKRARGKMARRERKTIARALDQFAHDHLRRVVADASTFNIDANIGQSDIPRPGESTPDGTARIESVTFTADTQHGLTSVVTKTRPIMSHDEIDAASIVGQRVAISCGYGSPSPARDGLSLPMSATLAATGEPALITRNVHGFGDVNMDGIDAKSGRAWWDS
jgi:hypothetical protein